MKTFKTIAAQGELRFVRMPEAYAVPKGAIKIEPVDGQLIVGHSETGHHHVMDADSTMMFRLPHSILECLLVVDRPDQLRHLREFDTHEPIAFEPGIYKVTTAREYMPQGWRRSAD